VRCARADIVDPDYVSFVELAMTDKAG